MFIRPWLARYPHYAVGILIFLTLMVFIGGVRMYAHEAKKQVAYDKARTFLESIIGMHQYYSKEIVPRIEASGASMDMMFSEQAGSFPYPAAVSIEFGSALQNVNTDLNTKVYSKYPFPIREARVLDGFEFAVS